MIRIHIDPKLRPVLAVCELQFRRWQLANINPMAPHLYEIVGRIAHLEGVLKWGR